MDPALKVTAGLWGLWGVAFLFSGLQTIAMGAFLRLMIHLEENTRASEQMLDQMRSRLGMNPERAESIFRS